MKNKLIFRILGALSSALIIVSVFVPFVRVTGYSQSLWQTNANSLYLPIIIIVFGAIGVLLFAINLKTELAYSTTGALLFFLITQSVPIINQGTFSTLNVGYYFLVVGTLLTGIMTFLCGLKSKQKVVEEVKIEEETNKDDSMINQIDRLYETQTVQNNEIEINQVEMIQPLQSVQSIEPIQPLSQSSNSLNMPIEENERKSEISNDLLQPTITEEQVENKPIVEQNTVIEEKNEQPVSILNPVISEFEAPKPEISMPVENPVVAEFEPVKEEITVQAMNPVIFEFATSEVNEINNMVQPTISNNVVTETIQPSVQSTNPVTSEFEAPSQFSFGAPQPIESHVENKPEEPQTIEPLQPLQPLGSDMDKVDVMADQSTVKDNNSSNLDIFG